MSGSPRKNFSELFDGIEAALSSAAISGVDGPQTEPTCLRTAFNSVYSLGEIVDPLVASAAKVELRAARIGKAVGFFGEMGDQYTCRIESCDARCAIMRAEGTTMVQDNYGGASLADCVQVPPKETA